MIDTKKRWWHWVWADGTERVHYVPSDGPPKKDCTEVQLAPLDAVVCEKGSREWACIMAMRGKKVSPHAGSNGCSWAPYDIADQDCGTPESGWAELPAEEPLRCPSCGEKTVLQHGVEYWMACPCGVSGPFKNTEAEAREAFRKMGGAK